MRNVSGPYLPRVRHPDEAPPRTVNIWDIEIYDGSDLKPFNGRQGSMDAFSIKSYGVRT